MSRRVPSPAASLAAVLVLLCVLVGLAVATETGTQWSLQQLTRFVPGLRIDQPSGTWVGGLEIAELDWHDETVRVQVRELQLRVNLSSLLLGSVRIEPLTASAVRVELPPSAATEPAPVELTEMLLPFITLSLPEVRVAHITIEADERELALRDAALTARWRGDRVAFEHFTVAWEDGRAQLSGHVALTGDYPLEVDGTLQHAALPGALSAALTGSVRALGVDATLDGEWPLRAKARLQPLEPGLPLSLELATREPITVEAGDETLRIPSAELTLAGEVDHLAGDLRLRLDERRYGPGELTAGVQWRDGRLDLKGARWQLADGRQPLTADCWLTSADGRWHCDGQLQQLPLAPWLPQQAQAREGSLSTPWRADGNYRQGMNLELDLAEIRGELDGTPMSGQVHISTDDGSRWQLRRVQLAVGNNRLSASGVLGADSVMEARATLPQLAQLHPPLRGSAELRATVRGDLAAPTMDASLEARDLAHGEWSATHLSATARLPQLGRQAGQLRLVLTDAAGSGMHLSGTLQGSGDRRQQRWQLQLKEAGGSDVTLHCDHSAAEGLDKGRLNCVQLDGSLALRQHQVPLALERPLTVNWHRAGPAIEIMPFCLRAEDASLCLESRTDLEPTPETPLTLALRRLPLAWLTPYAPRAVELEPGAHANARLHLERLEPLTASADVDIPSIAWRWPGREPPVTTGLEAVTAHLEITRQRATLQANARSGELGNLTLAASVDDPADRRQLRGHLQIDQLQAGAFSWLYPEGYELTGQLDGRLQLAGTLATPDLSGAMNLSGGTALLPALEEPLRELALQLRLEERRAHFDGRFRLGDGTGDLSGLLTVPEQWQQWQLQAELATRGVRLSPLPDSSLTVSSALALKADAADIRLTGDINVESADIRIRQLPPDTQRVSPDAEIVGGEPDAGPQLYADVQVNLGEKFHFTGFGADVYLAGTLQVRQRPDSRLSTRGEVRISKGRYRAYGQRLVVRRGSFLFHGPPDNPDIDLRAVREMPPDADVTVGVDVTGTLRYPLATLFSEPPMPDTEAAYYLLTGKPPPTAGQGSQLSAESALLSIGVAGASERAAGVAEKIGISDFQLSAGGGEQGTEAQVSGYLSPRLYVRYGSGLQEGANSVTFQYRVTRQLILEAVTGVNQALDVLYSFDIQ